MKQLLRIDCQKTEGVEHLQIDIDHKKNVFITVSIKGYPTHLIKLRLIEGKAEVL